MYQKYKRLKSDHDEIERRRDILRSEYAAFSRKNDAANARLTANDLRDAERFLKSVKDQIAEINQKYPTQILNGIAADAKARAAQPE